MPVPIEVQEAQLPSYLTQVQKQALARELERFPHPVDYYLRNPIDGILQGDGWTGLEVVDFATASKVRIRGIVLSNSCDISTENQRALPARLTFAPIIRVSDFERKLVAAAVDPRAIQDKLNDIRAQRVTTIFHLPKGGELEDEYIALLDDLHSVPLQQFVESKQDRLFILSQVGFYLLILKLSFHFCRLHEGIPRFDDLHTQKRSA